MNNRPENTPEPQHPPKSPLSKIRLSNAFYPILIGLGVDELSCSIPAIPSVKAQVRAYSLEQCQDIAGSALRKDTATAVRDLVPLDED